MVTSKSQDGAVFRIRNSGIVYFDVFDQVERALLYTLEEPAKNELMISSRCEGPHSTSLQE